MKVSIGIPFYNAEDFLADAINSVIKQTFEDWELILVNDGSTDNSLEIARFYEKKDIRIRVISDGLNKKLPYRLNQIIDESKYEYIARMDADDLMHPDRIKIQLNYLNENNDYDLVSTGLVSITADNLVKGHRNILRVIKSDGHSKDFPIIHASVLAKKSWFLRNRYSLDFPRAEDYELWCRATKNNDFKIIVLPDLLYFCREEGNIFPHKLIKSYKDGLNIRKLYGIGGNYLDILKVIYKCNMVRLLSIFKLEQSLSKRRNLKFDTQSEIVQQQETLNKILES
ncbi:glycosyltransferase family 2 protein [Acinetobacter radioresistens]|uniref:glycosyltransferase family 2 protein n=1 Tax=Acinetobacter radioresistens TaxID=40216 RepID=UPI000C3413B0|nr:glycosyltransferase family A protein [Acinetobacter radioresistens]MCK4081104.1 glycosyltransferase family 2 protein [Acinetobacter radioresistens]PKH31676.1 hypothetical protein BJF94_06225 [Acinetobacter radioresistens]